MHNSQDYRVIRTKQLLKNALLDMLASQPLEKIRVQALCSKAQVNKTTFYNHYRDIYDLYKEILRDFFQETIDDIEDYNIFFDNPNRFLTEFSSAIDKRLPDFYSLHHVNVINLFQEEFINILKENIYATCRIEKCIENDIRLDTTLNILLILRPKYGEKNIHSIVGVFERTVRALFR